MQRITDGRDTRGPTAARPATPDAGHRYYDTTLNLLLVYNGTTWQSVGCPLKAAQADRPSASSVPPGTLFFNEDIASMQFSDGVAWLTMTVDDNQSSSSLTPPIEP